MPKRDEPSKEVYHLWWKYLKRSEKYKEWCKKSRENQEGYTWREQWIKWLSESKEANPFYAIYLRFGDIFRLPFHKWWIKFKAERHGGVGMFYDIIDSDFADAIDQFYSRNERTPTLYEFKEEFKGRVKLNPWRIYLLLNLDRGQNIEPLIKEFTKIVRKEIRKQAKKLIPTLTIGPTNQLRFEEVERYLQVYDLRKKKRPWRKIAAEVEVYSKRTFDDDLRTVLIKEKEKAQRIIKNVEKGIFPGKYSIPPLILL